MSFLSVFNFKISNLNYNPVKKALSYKLQIEIVRNQKKKKFIEWVFQISFIFSVEIKILRSLLFSAIKIETIIYFSVNINFIQ